VQSGRSTRDSRGRCSRTRPQSGPTELSESRSVRTSRHAWSNCHRAAGEHSPTCDAPIGIQRPSKSTGSPLQSAYMTARYSSVRAPRSPIGTPTAASSAGSQPAPTVVRIELRAGEAGDGERWLDRAQGVHGHRRSGEPGRAARTARRPVGVGHRAQRGPGERARPASPGVPTGLTGSRPEVVSAFDPGARIPQGGVHRPTKTVVKRLSDSSKAAPDGRPSYLVGWCPQGDSNP
jgi:hypothetical protein